MKKTKNYQATQGVLSTIDLDEVNRKVTEKVKKELETVSRNKNVNSNTKS